MFFSTGLTYLEVLEQAKSGGNAYYILAFQWIAAELNQLAGASIPGGVEDAFDEAADLLADWDPDDVEAMSGNDPIRERFISLASTLDAYNNGLSGPEHCD
jgi:hypothetical protein